MGHYFSEAQNPLVKSSLWPQYAAVSTVGGGVAGQVIAVEGRLCGMGEVGLATRPVILGGGLLIRGGKNPKIGEHGGLLERLTAAEHCGNL